MHCLSAATKLVSLHKPAWAYACRYTHTGSRGAGILAQPIVIVAHERRNADHWLRAFLQNDRSQADLITKLANMATHNPDVAQQVCALYDGTPESLSNVPDIKLFKQQLPGQRIQMQHMPIYMAFVVPGPICMCCESCCCD